MKLVAVMLAAAVTLPWMGGCSRPSKPASEVQREYVSRFVEGFEFGEFGTMKAAGFDETTLDLLDLSVTDNAGNMFHADRAVVVVDAAADTVAFRLIGITGASTASGELWTLPEMIVPPEKLKINIR